MKNTLILVMVAMLTLLTSVAMADENGESKAGRLFLFQKCDETLTDPAKYDSFGCPNIPSGPWPIFPDNNRWGKLDYSLWGDTFKFSFSGRGLPPETNYTLIYYPDPWPGSGLICLGSGQTTPAWDKGYGKKGHDKKGKWGHKGGNLNIHGKVETITGLPIPTDANFNPINPSGAVGAKIWLVLSDDVQCSPDPHMIGWNPNKYLFEYNLIVFEHRAMVPDDDDDDDDDDD